MGVTTTSINGFLDLVKAIFSAIFVGTESNPAMATELLTFITSNWITLIGLIMWLFVAVVGTIRRFIPGV